MVQGVKIDENAHDFAFFQQKFLNVDGFRRTDAPVDHAGKLDRAFVRGSWVEVRVRHGGEFRVDDEYALVGPVRKWRGDVYFDSAEHLGVSQIRQCASFGVRDHVFFQVDGPVVHQAAPVGTVAFLDQLLDVSFLDVVEDHAVSPSG